MDNRNPMAPPAAGEMWWVRVVDGIFAILFGVAAVSWPGLTLVVLVWLFAVYALIAGAVQLVATFRAMGAQQTWWTHLLLGLASVGAGLVAIFYPAITALVLLWIVAYWAIVVGVLEIANAFTSGRFLLLVVGVLAIIFGFVLLANPLAGALAYVTVIGVFAIVRGILEILGLLRAPAAVPSPPA